MVSRHSIAFKSSSKGKKHRVYPGVFFNDFGLFVEITDPKIYGAIVALVVGFYSRSVIATIVSGLLSYWFIIFFLLR